MPTFLFNEIIFGPVRSRRLGNSLGINLLPTKSKLCNFNCVYCECGLNDESKSDPYPLKEEVSAQLENTLKHLQLTNNLPDVITFAGNGEPTIHPQFSKIIDRTLELRDLYAPQCEIAVLSNATMLRIEKIVDALKKVDKAFLKIDSAIEETAKMINQPSQYIPVATLAEQMKQLGEKLIIQTMIIRGAVNDKSIDNTTESEISALIEFYKRSCPKEIHLYSIARDTPYNSLIAVQKTELEKIAHYISQHGFIVHAF